MKKQKSKAKTGVARMLELAGQKKHRLLAACALSVVAAAARIVPFFTIYALVREMLQCYAASTQVDPGRLSEYAGWTLAAALVYGLCAFFSSSLAHTAAYDIIYALRLQLMEKLTRVPSGYFTQTTQGAIKKILSDDTEQLEVFIAHHICDIVAAVATPLLTLIYLFVMDWRLALVTLVPIFISLVLLSACLNKPDKATLQVELHDSQERMQGTIIEYIHGMPVIKVFNRTLGAFRRYERDINGFVDAVTRTAYANARPMGAYYAFFGAQLLFLLPTSLLLLQVERFLDFLPVVLMFFIVGSGLKEPLEDMMVKVLDTKRISEGMRRVDEILQLEEMSYGDTGAPTHYDVQFENVTFAYGDGAATVDDVSFTLSAGNVTGLVGPSGGGKSTLAQLLLRFYAPQQGTIRIGGVDIASIPPERLTRLVSYVFQESVLFHDTVENNIRMGDTSASHEDVVQAAKNAEIHEVIQRLPQGYDTVIGEGAAFLSGGERQRLAIARVFLRDTPIVVLDEATAYADAENEARIQQAFARLAKNKTVLIIAHRLKTVEKADQILVMQEGRLQGVGTHNALLAACPLYAEMVAANERRERWMIRSLRREVQA